MYGHLPCAGGIDAFIARVPELGLEGYDVIIPSEELAAWRDRFVALGATCGSLGSWTIARIEAGRPEWGIDMDETTLAQEANLEALNALSFTKGCYTGQETVARIHFRGHVNRYLRGLRFGTAALPTGARLVDGEGREVGDVRSVSLSPRLGGVALGMVRREVAADDALQATWEGGSTTVVVQELPFPL
jgi:folate-binding protein YgfZ